MIAFAENNIMFDENEKKEVKIGKTFDFVGNILFSIN